ncbi:MAG: hypothetical protein LBQ66_07165 [Planctomycetaceae bacterium]|nr:hypothetical protein [Planctomycetaceae bacterium]
MILVILSLILQAVGLHRSVENDIPTQTSITQECKFYQAIHSQRNVITLKHRMDWK